MNINADVIKSDWHARGFSFGIFYDPPGQEWIDFIHASDELFMVKQGKMEIILDDKSFYPKLGEEIFIPKGCIHSVKNIGNTEAIWFYGYN